MVYDPKTNSNYREILPRPSYKKERFCFENLVLECEGKTEKDCLRGTPHSIVKIDVFYHKQLTEPIPRFSYDDRNKHARLEGHFPEKCLILQISILDGKPAISLNDHGEWYSLQALADMVRENIRLAFESMAFTPAVKLITKVLEGSKSPDEPVTNPPTK